MINKKSKLFQNLVDKNETENLIPVNSNDDIFEKLYICYNGFNSMYNSRKKILEIIVK